MKQFTTDDYDNIVKTILSSNLHKDTATMLYNSNWYEIVGMNKAAFLQLHQTLLCMPFEDFHHSVASLLGRSVCSLELGNPKKLIDEAIKSKATIHTFLDLLSNET